MTANIDEDKLRAAKEKLACHIQPPNAHAVQTAASCSVPQAAEVASDRVRLTQMTSAGG